MNKEVWKKVCDDDGLSYDHWLRSGPRPRGPVENCPCAYCDLTRKYEELLAKEVLCSTTRGDSLAR